MNCYKVKEQILTDYVDGQMDEEGKTQIEKHLAGCEQCREYELEVRKTVIEPFNFTERINPPEAVWTEIKGQIESAQPQKVTNPFADLIRRIRSFIFYPKPALAVAAIVAVLLIVVTVVNLPPENKDVEKVHLENQIECVDYLMSVFNQDSIGENGGFETSIEEFFL